MKLRQNFGSKDLSPINQVRFGEILVITSPLDRKSNYKPSPQILIKPGHTAHKSDPTDYNNPSTSPLTPKQRMRELGFKVEKNLNKRLPPVPIRHLDNGTGCELKNTEFPKFGFRTGLDKMYQTKCSSSPQLNHIKQKPSEDNLSLKALVDIAKASKKASSHTKYNRNPPPPLNLLKNQPKQIAVTIPPTHKILPNTQLHLAQRIQSDLSGFISNFKNTLPDGEDDSDSDIESTTIISPTKFDWIKNMSNLQNIKRRQSFAIEGGNATDLSGLDEPFSESFRRSVSSPTSYSSTSSSCDSDTNSEHSLITPKDDTMSSPLTQTLDILCGDSNNNIIVEGVAGEDSLNIPLSDIARANLGKWSQLRERKLTRRGNQAAGLGSSQRIKGRTPNINNAQQVSIANQPNSQSEAPNGAVTFAPDTIQNRRAKKAELESSNLSYDLSGILESYKYQRRRTFNKGYEIHDDLSSILDLYLDPELIGSPPALSTATSQDCDFDEDEANDTFDDVKSSLNVLERIHQGLKLSSGASDFHTELSDHEGSGSDLVDLYFPDLVYCQNGGGPQR